MKSIEKGTVEFSQNVNDKLNDIDGVIRFPHRDKRRYAVPEAVSRWDINNIDDYGNVIYPWTGAPVYDELYAIVFGFGFGAAFTTGSYTV